jgi:hypothetical protein
MVTAAAGGADIVIGSFFVSLTLEFPSSTAALLFQVPLCRPLESIQNFTKLPQPLADFPILLPFRARPVSVITHGPFEAYHVIAEMGKLIGQLPYAEIVHERCGRNGGRGGLLALRLGLLEVSAEGDAKRGNADEH